VVGGGFAGLRAVHRLASEPVDVTLVDRHNYNTFQPLLYQVASAGLDEGGVAHTIRAIFRNNTTVDVLLGTVVGIDFDQRVVQLEDGGTLDYDALVLAAGATTNDFGVPGVTEHAFPLYTLSEAIQLRQHILRCFESAERHPSLVDEGALTCVMVGGGPTGVETAGMLAELFTRVLSKGYRRIDVRRARVVLIEMGTELLTTFRPRSRRHAYESLVQRGVDIRFGERVTEVTSRGVRLASGDELPTSTVIWTAGVRANALADRLDVDQTTGGRIAVEPDLSLPDHPEVFVVGDISGSSPPGADQLLPQLAPVAMQAGTHAAEQVMHRVGGQPTRPFQYRDKGAMATIGRHAAVADLPFGISLGGTVAWLAWLVLHLIYLIGFENRAQVLVQWAWNYLTWNWGPRLVIERDG
jgi:NADH:ubiquinone reductase (H+-translocating)